MSLKVINDKVILENGTYLERKVLDSTKIRIDRFLYYLSMFFLITGAIAFFSGYDSLKTLGGVLIFLCVFCLIIDFIRNFLIKPVVVYVTSNGKKITILRLNKKIAERFASKLFEIADQDKGNWEFDVKNQIITQI